MLEKKLFLAVSLPMELKRELFGVQKEINNQLEEDYAKAKVFKWVMMENLHLTLKFIGEVGEEQISKIVENIEKVTKNQKPFIFETKEICYDNIKKCPHLIWLTTGKNKNLENLAEKFNEKKFIGHITLAKIKEWVFKRIEVEERPSVNQRVKREIPVKSIELMESILKKTGYEYRIIKSFVLNNNK